MNIPSAASRRRATLDSQRREIINLINNAANKGHFSVLVQDVNPMLLDEVRVQGYEVISESHCGDDSCVIKW